MQTKTIEVSEIALIDKHVFDRFFKMAGLGISEYNFTNFYMWRDYYKLRYSIVSDFLCIISVGEDAEPFAFFPVGDYQKIEELKYAIISLQEYFKWMGWAFKLKRVSFEQLETIKKLDICYAEVEDRANFDYIYPVKSLATLSGKKLDGKRNHINKFKKLHTFEYEDVSEANIQDCIKILEQWCQQRNYTEHKSLIAERKANYDVLKNLSELSVKGALIKVDGVAQAFSVGEQINNDTVVIHIEKANAEIQGLYPLINQQFLSNAWSHLEFVNREQDLGLEGLRKAKMSYNPISFVKKYDIELC